MDECEWCNKKIPIQYMSDTTLESCPICHTYVRIHRTLYYNTQKKRVTSCQEEFYAHTGAVRCYNGCTYTAPSPEWPDVLHD